MSDGTDAGTAAVDGDPVDGDSVDCDSADRDSVDGDSADRDSVDRDSVGGAGSEGGRPCPICETPMYHRHCKYVCPSHGVVYDCSDTFY